MGLDKITLSLYDFLGYLLPGVIMYVALSVFESSFVGTHYFAISTVTDQKVLALVMAYLLGHLSHALGTMIFGLGYVELKGKGAVSKMFNRITGWMKKAGRGQELNPAIVARVDAAIEATYGIDAASRANFTGLDTYLLADEYIVANGGSAERDMLTSREGIFKGAMAAFVVLAAVVLLTLVFTPPSLIRIDYLVGPNHKYLTIGIAVFLLVAAWVFWRQFKFFNQAKNNNALLTFLALRAKAKLW